MATHSKTGHVHSPAVAGGAVQWTNAFAYLVITDGSTTITLQDGLGGNTDYPLHRQVWTPMVAGLRRSQLGGRTPYEDVVEDLLIQVRGTSAQDAFSKLAALARLLEQAERWARGENVSAVVVKFCPKGALLSSIVNPLQAAVMGRAPGDQTAGVGLTGEWNAAGTHFVIPAVHVRFLRRGQWLMREQAAYTILGVANGELATLAVPEAVDVPSPTRISLTNFGWGKVSASRFHGAFLLLGEPVGGSAPIVIAAAEAGTATAYTSVTDAGQNPRNTNVLRYTPTGTTEASSGSITAGLPSTTKRAAVFLNIRPSATVDFSVRVQTGASGYKRETPPITIPANATLYPQWHFCGIVSIPETSGHAWFVMITAEDASSFLDIDTLVVCDADAVQVLSIPGVGDDITRTGLSVQAPLTHNHNLLTEIAPSVVWDPSGGDPAERIPYAGDAALMTKTATLYGLLLATGGGTGTAGNDWRQADLSADTVFENTWTLNRRPACLSPQ